MFTLRNWIVPAGTFKVKREIGILSLEIRSCEHSARVLVIMVALLNGRKKSEIKCYTFCLSILSYTRLLDTRLHKECVITIPFLSLCTIALRLFYK